MSQSYTQKQDKTGMSRPRSIRVRIPVSIHIRKWTCELKTTCTIAETDKPTHWSGMNRNESDTFRPPRAFIVTWGTLWVLAPEVALIVAQEEHDLNPALQRHLPLDDVIRLGENPDFQWILHFNSWTIKLWSACCALLYFLVWLYLTYLSLSLYTWLYRK